MPDNNVHTVCQSVTQWSVIPILLRHREIRMDFNQAFGSGAPAFSPMNQCFSPLFTMGLSHNPFDSPKISFEPLQVKPVNKGPMCTNKVLFLQSDDMKKEPRSIHPIHNQ